MLASLRSASQTSSKRSLGRYTRERKDDAKRWRRRKKRRDAEKGPQGEDEDEDEDEDEGEGEDESIESDKAACAAPVAFNEHSASAALGRITWRFPQTAFAKLSSAKPREEVDMVYKQNWPLGIRSPFRGPPSTLLAFIAGEEPQL
ncbi:hypothetical protein G5I_09549 [Acromyrmex echinatior]|uniref:Uncharacterized protein n=1 Tax=Acromyrmex echinatior TaxID=103372 RepID=F4WUH8_ACREC|nr:hypothetical protein G5I_09549 [Acromyrmex echinatior]